MSLSQRELDALYQLVRDLTRSSDVNAVANHLFEATEWKQAEEAVRAINDALQALIHASPMAIVVLDPDGVVQIWNPAAERIFGWSAQETIGQRYLVIPPEEWIEFLTVHKAALQGQTLTDAERQRRRKDGTLIEVSISTALLRNASGHVVAVMGVIADITARKQAEEALRMEAEIEASLARAGRELISSLNTPELLDRLCRLTADILECDYSHTLLWQPAEDAYVAVAGYGETQEEAETRRAFKIPRPAFSRLIELLDKYGVVERQAETARDPVTLGVLRRLRTSTMLWLPLRHGSEIIGVQSAGYRIGKRPVPRHTRIARGISQIASLALTNTRLFEELERANRLKEDFISSVSHELRTPLSIILGYTELLRDDAFGPLTSPQLNTLGRIESNARELFDLITTLLDLSRLQHRSQPMNIEEVSVKHLFAELELDIRQLAAHSPLRIDWRLESPCAAFLTDPVKLKMILKNFILNALKFTEEGSIVIAARQGEDGMTFSVQDTGIGISSEVLPFIFEPFRQAENDHARHEKGVGLGLYIVRQLSDMLGGKVSVTSELGKGSTFQVWLPLADGQ